MKIGKDKYLSVIITTKPVTKEQREALRKGVSHIHGNPIRKPLIRLIEKSKGGSDERTSCGSFGVGKSGGSV